MENASSVFVPPHLYICCTCQNYIGYNVCVVIVIIILPPAVCYLVNRHGRK